MHWLKTNGNQFLAKIDTQEWCVFQGGLNLLEVFSKIILCI